MWRTRPLKPEREEELINKVAEEIVKRGMETPAILFFESIKPLSFFGTMLFRQYTAALKALFPSWTDEVLLLLEKRDNMERILKRIEELEDKKEEGKKGKEEKKGFSLRRRIFGKEKGKNN